jgi:2-polyprenyl-3-methyl-5-hydroxy-6-metoxy-1,4-benzoquinol methylase
LKAIDDMRDAGVLIGSRDDVSRYSSRIVEDYLAHRPFPRELAELIIRSAPIADSTRVLDLAGGPGELALALAQVSSHVSLMELSRGFLKSAQTRSKRLGVNLTPLHDSCNRLVFRQEEYDVITVAQALHWLDDVLVCRGICHVLRPGGSFFVIHSAIDLEDRHPLSFILGNKSILGHKDRQPYAAQIQALLRRLTLLFDALDAPDVHRIDSAQRWEAAGGGPVPRIVPAGVSLFRQRRPVGVGFARAFLTPQHIEPTGQTPAEFWKDLETRCAGAAPEQIVGTHDWAVLHFRRGGARAESPPLTSCEIAEIGYEAQSTA